MTVAAEQTTNSGQAFTPADAAGAYFLDVPEGATAARCVECGAEFAGERAFEFDAETHKLLRGHRLFEFTEPEPEMSDAERQALNAEMARWYGIG